MEAPLPDVLTFSSPDSDATITFINSTTVNGLIFQHGKAFDIVASADLLSVRNICVLFIQLVQFIVLFGKDSALTSAHLRSILLVTTGAKLRRLHGLYRSN